MARQNESQSQTASPDQGKQVVNIVLGCFVAGLLVFFIGLLIFIFVVLPRRPYSVNKGIKKPTIKTMPQYTNESEIAVKGRGEPDMNVILYVNDDKTSLKTKSRSSGKYEFDVYEFDEEGEYKFQTASTRGWIKKERSEKSKSVRVIYDVTPPKSSVSLDEIPEKTGSDQLSVSGKVSESGLDVILERGEDTFSTESGSEGVFEISGIQLENGLNKFSVVLCDKAGNETKSKTKIEVEYDPSYAGRIELDGDGASVTSESSGASSASDDEGLPSSAGELGKIMQLARNSGFFTMVAIGLMLVASLGILNLSIVGRVRKKG